MKTVPLWILYLLSFWTKYKTTNIYFPHTKGDVSWTASCQTWDCWYLKIDILKNAVGWGLNHKAIFSLLCSKIHQDNEKTLFIKYLTVFTWPFLRSFLWGKTAPFPTRIINFHSVPALRGFAALGNAQGSWVGQQRPVQTDPEPLIINA